VHYTFEEPKGAHATNNNNSNNADGAKFSVDEWIDALERSKELAISQNVAASVAENGFGDMSSSMSSPASTMHGVGSSGAPTFSADAAGTGYTISDRAGRNQLSKSQASLEDSSSINVKRNRFSKRQSKNGLGAAF